MNRRSFLGLFVSAVAARPLAALLPPPTLPPIPPGISMRFIQQWDPSLGFAVTRYDVLYGFGTLTPTKACIVAAD